MPIKVLTGNFIIPVKKSIYRNVSTDIFKLYKSTQEH